MLSKDQKALLDQLLSSTTPEQKVWLAGFMQGQIGLDTDAQAQGTADKPPVMIYYATETGNSKALSLSLMKSVKAAGFKVKNSAVNRIKLEDIDPKTIAIFLCSTHGEGDPPETSIPFFDRLKAAADNSLKDLSYAVLGLGDSSYEIFCGAATNLDTQLKRLGGEAFQEKELFDVDYAIYTPKWIESTVNNLNKLAGHAGTAPQIVVVTEEQTLHTGKGYTRLEPVKGIIKDTLILNDIDSQKQTYHIEVTYDDDIHYSCGDAIGIILPDENETPRLYSIASSPSYHEDEIHMTVALATYTKEDGTIGYGLASKYLADLKEGDKISFYISQNQLFNLAPDDQDIIMVGPGTGIAPFRSFIFERAERGSEGRNWLFFGDQHAHCDFLYQAEWQEHLATEVLHKIDLAFSRDQDEKIYVQDRIREQADDVVEWLDNGAVFYVCGAKDPMSKDVHKTLVDIISDKKSIDRDAAEDYLSDMEEQGRYLRDVY
ncbi:MAG: flavodoxin domain-containing protein [Alphaproteobacteria bacterium]|nr:flavodoxin domain-containing protein [Alphaproteobacteria bacterium]